MAENPAKRRRKEQRRKDSALEKAEEQAEMARSAAEAAQLEKELFGGTEEDFEGFGRENRAEDETPPDGLLGFEDRRGAKGTAEKDDMAGPRPAWVDEEDEAVTVNIARVNRLRKLRAEEEETVLSGAEYAERLRVQHAKLNRGTDWARLDGVGKRKVLREGGWEHEEEEEGREEILREAGDLVVRSKTTLPPTVLETTRMRDANHEEPTKGVVRSVGFHPNAQLLLTAGLDKTVRFFNVDGKKNPKVQGLFLEDMPVYKAGFTGDGKKVVAAGRRKWFYVIDLASARVDRVDGIVGREEKSLESFALSPLGDQAAFLGNEGHVSLVSLHSKQWIGTLKMNGSARAAAYAPDGNTLLTSGGDGEVYHWDVRTRRCLFRTRDEGCVKSSAIDVSSDGRYFAAGADSGVVNVYKGASQGLTGDGLHEPRGLFSANPAPLKTVMNLTTVADTVKFNPDGQILAIASRMKKDSLRLVHLPSCTVFQNWPTARSPLQFVHCLDFSPGGGFLAVGNAKGKVLLYRLHHYDRA